MIGLLGIGFVAGLIAGISPCILPVLPVMLVGGATDARAGRRSLRRPLSVVAGLIVSFSVFTLVGSELLSALGLPQDLLRDGGIVLLAVLGIGLLVPPLGEWVARPFARIRVPRLNARAGGFVLGLGAGAVFVPCAGPVLAAITVIGATHHVGLTGVLLTLAFALGAAVPLLVVALAGESLVSRVAWIRGRAPSVRRVGGAVLIAMAAVIGFSLTDGLERAVPGYTNALQNGVESSSFALRQLDALKNTAPVSSALTDCEPDYGGLQTCGVAPNFRGIVAWLNTPGDRPLSLPDLRGKVVLIDFWTYSCINCQRSLPHVEAWYRRYHADGLDVIGVSTPEFAFEHVISNVKTAARQLGVVYPIAIDNNYATWDAYDNNYWPAEYLIDAHGVVRHVDFGEGDYYETEQLIRQLLVAAHPGAHLPPETNVANTTPIEPITPESYLGYERIDDFVSTPAIRDNEAERYASPSMIDLDDLALSGVWTIDQQSILAGDDAKIELHFQANDVYLVVGGHGTLTETLNGVTSRIAVGGIPRLYTLVSSANYEDAVLSLKATPGIRAYDFTFG